MKSNIKTFLNSLIHDKYHNPKENNKDNPKLKDPIIVGIFSNDPKTNKVIPRNKIINTNKPRNLEFLDNKNMCQNL